MTSIPPRSVIGCAAGVILLAASFASAEGDPPSAPAAPDLHPFVTTVHVTWAAFPPGTRVARLLRAEEGEEPRVVRTLGPTETEVTDYGLRPETSYRYAITRVDAAGAESPPSPYRVTVTAPDPGDVLRVASLDVLCPIYTGLLPPGAFERIARGLELARLFYWRATSAQLDLRLVPRRIDAVAPPTAGARYENLEGDLRRRGVEDDQYDAVFCIGEGMDGCWGGFVVLGRTGGAFGRDCGAAYPGRDPSIDYDVTWAFTHEFGHVLDLVIARGSHHNEMLFNHFPWIYPMEAGETFDAGSHYDGMGEILRRFRAWNDFAEPWDGYLEVDDADGDRFPDRDSRLAMDETRFGSSPLRRDTDGDGVDDRAEFAAGLFAGSDPRNPDTDGDGEADGADPFPLDDLRPAIARAPVPPVIDGLLDPQWMRLARGFRYTADDSIEGTLYALWDDEFLYVALAANQDLRLYLSIDGSAENGRFETNGVFPGSGASVETTWGDCWGDGMELRAAFGEPDLHAGPVRVEGARVASGLQGALRVLEIAVPRRLPPGINFCYAAPGSPEIEGLNLHAGKRLGISATVSRVETGVPEEPFSGAWSSFFEPYRYHDIVLAPAGETSLAGAAGALPRRLDFWPVQPNPVQGSALLRFALPPSEGGSVPVELALLDVRGRLVRTLVARELPPGVHEIVWNGQDSTGETAGTGVYFARLSVGGEVITRKMLYLP